MPCAVAIAHGQKVLPGRARRPPADEDLREHNKRGRIPSLDGLRTVSITFVLIAHFRIYCKVFVSIQNPGPLDRESGESGRPRLLCDLGVLNHQSEPESNQTIQMTVK